MLTRNISFRKTDRAAFSPPEQHLVAHQWHNGTFAFVIIDHKLPHGREQRRVYTEYRRVTQSFGVHRMEAGLKTLQMLPLRVLRPARQTLTLFCIVLTPISDTIRFRRLE